jgi:glutamate synthase (NADPH/NADH) small chain
VTGLKVADIVWQPAKAGERPTYEEVAGSERVMPCDMAFLAMGFLHPEPHGVLAQLDIELDERGNVATTDYQTNQTAVFAAGDMRTGQSLVVRCINEGRECARAIDAYLMGESNLEARADSLMRSA